MTLEIRNLNKTYRNGVRALKDVSLTIDKGMFGLLGPNGAGKSTLMRTIATLQRADSGTINLDSINVLEDHVAVRRALGYLPQEFGFYPKVTAMRMLHHFAALKGIASSNERREVCNQLLERINLWAYRHRRLETFSGGMKQRLGIAIALLGSPRLIIVDEPTAGLDPEERTRFHNLLCEVSESVIVLLSTHIVSDVHDICQHMAVMNDGQVVQTGEPATLMNELKGKVWAKTVNTTEVEKYKSELNVISTRLFAGRVILHVHDSDRPDAGFQPIDGDLQDVYFLSMHQADRQTPQEFRRVEE